MKVCQIATVGRNPEWIQLGLFRYPTNLLVLIVTEEYLEKAQEIAEGIKGINSQIEIVKDPRNAQYLVNFLKTLINQLSKEEYQILINVTSGLVSWQLLFYGVATILRDKIHTFFIIDKERKEPLEMVLYKPLSKTEREVLMAVPDEGGTLSKITQMFRKVRQAEIGKEEGSSALISRYLKTLAEEGLVESQGRAKVKEFHLTNQGVLVKSILTD